MAVRAPVQEVRRTLLGFSPDRIDPHAAFRCALGIAIPLLGGMLLGHPELGGAAAIGAWTAGLTTFHKDARPRAMLAVLAGTVMGVGVVVGGYSEKYAVLSVAVTVAWCLVFGLVGSLSEIAGSVAATCGTAIFLAHGLTTHSSPVMAGIAATIGGLIQALITVLLPRHRHRSERLALAAVYRWLATDARAMAENSFGPPATAPLELAERVLDTHRETPEVFLTALGHARRLRAITTSVGLARSRLVDAEPTAARHLAAVLREAADALDLIADALEQREVPRPVWHARLKAAVKQVSEDNKTTYVPIPEYEANRLLSLIRAAAATAATPTVEDGDSDRMDPSRWRLVPEVPPVLNMLHDGLIALRANLSWRSTALRQATRTALAVGVASIGAFYWPGTHGYWLPLTAWLVLKADFAGTIGKGIGRMIGTSFGALVAGLLSSLLPATPLWIAPVVIAFAFTAYLLFQASYVAYSAGVAAFVVFNMELGGNSPLSAAEQRVAATIVGGIFALLFFLTWPKWETPLLGDRLADLTERYAAYADLVLARHAEPSRRKEGRLRSRLDELRLARSETDAAIARAAAEPVTAPGPMSADARRIAHDLGWAARPMLVLEAHLPSVEAPELPPVDAFRSAITDAYRELAARLRGAEADPEVLPTLRVAYENLVEDTADEVTPDPARQSTTRRRALYGAECETLVTALESVGEQIGRSGPH